MKVVYCGFGRAGQECFYQLINNLNIKISNIVVFTHDNKENKEFIMHLKHNQVSFYFNSVNDHYKSLLNFKPDLLISVYYRIIIKPKILKLVNYKAMNLHPSILPSYRGTKSSVWALINNEKKTGISFHYITDGVDEGKVILQKKIDIKEEDTAYMLYNKLISLFVLHLNTALRRLINNCKGKTQYGDISYYKRKIPFNGEKFFHNTTFNEAKRFVNAMYFPPHKGAYFCKKDNKKIEIKTIEKLYSYKHLFCEK
jgi:methionyl-tRNA formyltransferase